VENVQIRGELLGKTSGPRMVRRLPPTSDYKVRIEQLAAPETLKPGFYFIRGQPRSGLWEKDNQISYTGVWVSSWTYA